MKPLLATVLTALFLLPTLSHATDCQEALKQHSKTDLQLSFDKFDQDFSGGWRALQSEGCPKEVTVLIDRYLTVQTGNLRLLHWHLAQTLATADDSARAIEHAQQSLNPQEAEQHPQFHWNDYVYATLAFLQHDRAAFDTRLENMRQAAANDASNTVNYGVVVGLGRCFDLPYGQAYGSACRGAAKKTE